MDLTNFTIDLDNKLLNIILPENTSIKCPHCGESYYMEKYSSCTAAYYPPIMKNGVNINPDRNITTIYYSCVACGKEFKKKFCGGEEIE